MSEIDDIFTSKDKSKTVPSPSTSVSLLKAKKKAKKPKLVSAHEDPAHASSSAITPASKKRPPPETVVDTSANLPSLKRQKKETGPGKVRVRQTTKSDLSEPNGGLFKDSRGSGARRTTDEGLSIYKEDELGIRDDGGDTPLCPFDCDCCF
ncbi:hypothetical protein K443DRAFT_673756 [Laccaria amethystina LaAM-08-1]|uniref:DUF1764-domain-containing protein n=1 Tax=Laccaria amethystina LaAM-08-1 TaxID=1095629 RepID=A0A0C9YFJ8_9AGAR|nr:hypothetical protein K443DRAFT_673756 [Laccaria amethystina LaAM-08-1]